MNDFEALERHIMTSEHKVISKDAAQTVINGYKSRVIELERELHQIKSERLYEPYTQSTEGVSKTEWNKLQEYSMM